MSNLELWFYYLKFKILFEMDIRCDWEKMFLFFKTHLLILLKKKKTHTYSDGLYLYLYTCVYIIVTGSLLLESHPSY